MIFKLYCLTLFPETLGPLIFFFGYRSLYGSSLYKGKRCTVLYQCNLLRNRTQRMVSLHNVGLSYGVNAGDIGGQ